jgi:hypothetical protein
MSGCRDNADLGSSCCGSSGYLNRRGEARVQDEATGPQINVKVFSVAGPLTDLASNKDGGAVVAGNFRIKGPQHHHAAIGERNSWSRDAPPGWPAGPMKFLPPGPPFGVPALRRLRRGRLFKDLLREESPRKRGTPNEPRHCLACRALRPRTISL